MTQSIGKAEERIIIPALWHFEFAHAAGRAGSRFLVGLRDQQALLASPCSKCGRIYTPPRSYCEDCFIRTEDSSVQVGPEGTLEAFTVTYASFPGYPDPPYAVGYVRPDGASTAIGNFVSGIDLSDPQAIARVLTIGMRMVAAFHAKREARITDFHWEPA